MDLIVWNIIIVSSVLEIVLVVGFFLGKYAQPSFFFFFSHCWWSGEEGEERDKDNNGVGVRE